MSKSFITPHFEGQLGNQLFIIAAALAYSWDFGKEAFFPQLNESRYRLSHHRERLFFRLNASQPKAPIQKEFWEKIWFSPERIPPCAENLQLYGYFQSWKHFHHHKEKLLPLFSPHPDTLSHLEKKYPELLSFPETAAIHVRTSMKKAHSKMPFLGVRYVKDAIELFPKKTKFAVFSDGINWCKRHLSSLDADITFIEGNDEVDDLILMSKMKHQVIANSTYSWWGAYLNENPEKKIIAPATVSINAPTEHLYFPDWIQLPIHIEPYPADMYDYDAYSQSIDNNE